MSWLPAAVSIFGSLFGGGGGGSSAASNDQNAINQWLIPQLEKEATRGMDPALIGAAQTSNDAEFLRQINSMASAMGPGFHGMGDIPYDQAISDATLNSQIAGQQQAFKNQALGDLSGISGQYGQEAVGLPQNNPWQSAASAIAGIPSGGGSGGGNAVASWISRMFGHGNSGAVNFGQLPIPDVPGMNGPNIIPGLGIPIPSFGH